MACMHSPSSIKVASMSWAFDPEEPTSVELACKCGVKWMFTRRLSREVIHWPTPRHPAAGAT